MSLRRYATQAAFCGLAALAVSGTALAGPKTDNTLLGAGLGAVAGAVFSQGDPLATIGAAAAGGLLGNILTDDGHHRRGYRASYNRGPQPRYVQERFDHRGRPSHRGYHQPPRHR